MPPGVRADSLMSDVSGKDAVTKGLFAFFLLGSCGLIVLVTLRPIIDPDFWWHLKTGEVMLQGKALLTSDPFAYTSQLFETSREQFILRGYWLWQVSYALVWGWLGYYGVALLSGLLLVTVALSIWKRMQAAGASPCLACLAVAVALFVLSRFYLLERPQVISFLFGSLLMGLLESARRGGRLSLLLFPLMVVWANCHPGVIVGDILLVLFVGARLVETRFRLALCRKEVLWAGGGILCSLACPDGYAVFFEIYAGNSGRFYQDISEYSSAFWWFANRDYFVALIFAVVLAGGYGLLRRKFDLFTALVFLVLSYLSLSHMRVVAFYAVVAFPAVLPGIASGGGVKPAPRSPLVVAMACGVVLLAGVLCYRQGTTNWSLRDNIYPGQAPVQAAEFLAGAGLQGNMFNEYKAGGYLIWRLYPQYRVFIDPRCLNYDVFQDYKGVTGADFAGYFGKFGHLLQKYDIDYVVQSCRQENGKLHHLFRILLFDRGWKMLYMDDLWYVAVKDNGRNERQISQYGAGSGQAVAWFTDRLSRKINGGEDVVKNLVSRADLAFYAGDYAAAEKDLIVALEHEPGNATARKMLEELSSLQRLRSRG